MDRITDKIANLARALNKDVDPNREYIDYKTLRKQYEAKANEEVSQLQQRSKKARVEAIHGRSDLNPKWTFANLVEDSDDVIEAVSIAQSFIAAHDDPAWRQSGSHMMLFYGDYGRGKSHIAGAIAHQNKICHIDRQQPVQVKRVAYEKPGVIAQLLAPLNVALAGSARRAHGPEIGQFRVGCRQFKRQWVVGRKRTKAGAIQRVWSGRVNLDIAKFPDRLSKFKPAGQPFRPTDPIGLHEAHFFRPARQPVQRTQQIIGKIRNLQKPLG